MATPSLLNQSNPEQYDESEKDSSLIMPKGKSPTLYQVNPSSDVTPMTRGQTTSDNQLKPGTKGG